MILIQSFFVANANVGRANNAGFITAGGEARPNKINGRGFALSAGFVGV
jgi:hypothetical protein